MHPGWPSIPPRRFILKPWIPVRRGAGLYGSEGVRKTTLMKMLCTSTALNPLKFPNTDWLGLPARQCRWVLLFCEDNFEEMLARQDAINRVRTKVGFLVHPPSAPMVGRDGAVNKAENGKVQYKPRITWTSKGVDRRSSEAAINLLKVSHPELFDGRLVP
jgi:hypothetical protein